MAESASMDLEAHPFVPRDQRVRRLVYQQWRDLRDFVHELCNWECGYCGHRFKIGETPECDHKVPLARGGTNDVLNLVTACKRCNARKGMLTAGEFIASRVGNEVA